MAELKHTAGPWAAKKLSGSYADPGWVVLWPDKSKPGVHMRRIDWQGQMTEADAKLVAAAPDLLDALQMLKRDGNNFAEWHEKFRPAIDAIDAAIAKATEGTP